MNSNDLFHITVDCLKYYLLIATWKQNVITLVKTTLFFSWAFCDNFLFLFLDKAVSRNTVNIMTIIIFGACCKNSRFTESHLN